MISDATVNDFVDAVQEEYGRTLSDADAHLILFDLARYFDALAKIVYRDRMAAKIMRNDGTSGITGSEQSQ